MEASSCLVSLALLDGHESRSYSIDTRRSEILLGFYVRAGLWIDGIEILTSLGRRSGVYGNAKAASGFVTIAPCPRSPLDVYADA